MAEANAENKSSIMSCDFEIFGNFTKEVFEKFAVAQAKILGLRGFITQVSGESYKGELQGEGKVIEAFKQVIATAAAYLASIKEFVIKNLKAIADYTYDAFEIRDTN